MKTSLIHANHSKGRLNKIDVIVIHCTTNTIQSADNTFHNPTSKVSAHYGVAKNGDLWQWVKEEDTAWHAGLVIAPSAKIVQGRPGVNPNSYSIGIEFENNGNEPLAYQQIAVGRRLISRICTTYNFPKDREHVLGHNQIRATKTCPGQMVYEHILDLLATTLTDPITPGPSPSFEAASKEHLADQLNKLLSLVRAIKEDHT